MPWGIVLGPFLGAVIGELLGGRETKDALRSGFGSLLGFLLGTFVKCILCGSRNHFCIVSHYVIAGFEAGGKCFCVGSV